MYRVIHLLRHGPSGAMYVALITGGPAGSEVVQRAWGPLKPSEYADATERLSHATIGPDSLERTRALLGNRDATSFVGEHLRECEQLQVSHTTTRQRRRGQQPREVVRTRLERYDGTAWVPVRHVVPGYWVRRPWQWLRRLRSVRA